MPFASLRNAIPRKTNKERAQPAARKKFGLLEKHKDYVLRAQDFHKKQRALRNLKLKAAFRNPDEFYFGMHKAKTKAGVHTLEHDTAHLPHEYIKLLKTQDRAYVTMRKAIDEKKAAKLQSSLHLLVDEPRNKHTIFVDSEEEAKQFEPASHFGTVPELAGRAYNRPRREILEDQPLHGPTSRKALKKVEKMRAQAYRELSQRVDRANKMRAVLDHMEVEKAAMGKGQKYKVKDGEDGKPPVYKWKRERQR